MRMRLSFRDLIFPLLFFLSLPLLFSVPIKGLFNTYDEGFAVFNAVRILHHDIPYKDFWAIYPPGQFYLLAGLFRIAGESLLVARIYDTLLRIVIVLCIFLLGNSLGSRRGALFSSIVAALMLSTAQFYTYAVFPSIALSLLSILGLIRFSSTGQLRFLFVSGVLCGVSSIFRWDIALYTIIANSAAIGLDVFRKSEQGNLESSKPRIFLKSMFIFLGGALAVIVSFYGFVGLQSGFEPLWEQVVAYPALELHDVRRRPYPSLLINFEFSSLSYESMLQFYQQVRLWLLFYFPIIVYIIAIPLILIPAATSKGTLKDHGAGNVAVTIFGALLLAQSFSRFDSLHALPTSIIAFLVLTNIIHQRLGNNTNRRLLFASLVIIAGITFLYLLWPVGSLVSLYKEFPPLHCQSLLARSDCIYLNEDQESAVSFIEAHTRVDEPIFVGNHRHDIIFINDIGFYFLAGRQAASFYHELYPGVATREDVQKIIIEELQDSNVNYIVLVEMPEPSQRGEIPLDEGSDLLDEFLRSRFKHMAASFGTYKIYTKVP